MKTLFFLLISSVSILNAGITVFEGEKASWGWSDKTTYSKQAVVEVLEKNWGKTNPLNLQAKVDDVTAAEFLWKITPDLVDEAMKTDSSFMTGKKVESMVLTFQPSGRCEITLYSQDKLVGRVRAWTSSKRVGDEYVQLAEGEYKVLDTNPDGWSDEFNCKMPNQIELNGGAKTRGVKIHTGDISGEAPGKNEYHGCIRVSEPVGRQFMRLIPVGTTVKVVWK